MPSRKYSAVGQHIRAVRETGGLTLEELAGLTGLTPEALKRLEQGYVSPPMETISRIAGALGVTVRELADAARTAQEPPL